MNGSKSYDMLKSFKLLKFFYLNITESISAYMYILLSITIFYVHFAYTAFAVWYINFRIICYCCACN